jgi:hypothetical protein
MEMVSHKTISVKLPRMLLAGFEQRLQEALLGTITLEDAGTVIAPVYHMAQATISLNSDFASHCNLQRKQDSPIVKLTIDH